jgi:FtsP/CotA-like multicopper oxidase with cupredoxin domain
LVNAAVDTHFKFMIDNHTMSVIGADLVPIKPYDANVVSIGMGQRYDLIFTANQKDLADKFWMRAIPQSASFEFEDNCVDETRNLVPFNPKTVGANPSLTADVPVTFGFNEENLFRWMLNSTTMVVEWDNPTLMQVMSGNKSFEKSNAVMELPTADEWVYVAISTTLAVPHPIHLHGHDFFVVAEGTGAYTSDVALNLDNPPRRDTAVLPASGFMVMAFQADNPGAWLMHCHIGK